MQNLIYIPVIAASLVIALLLDQFSEGQWAKARPKTSSALYFGVFFACMLAAQLIVQQPSAYLLGLLGFWLGGRIGEGRKNRRLRKEWQASLTSSITKLLDERNTPADAIEVDITGCSEAALQNKITELTKAGYTVTTTHNHNTNKRTLSVSGDAQEVRTSK